jgi:hypothetical protein
MLTFWARRPSRPGSTRFAHQAKPLPERLSRPCGDDPSRKENGGVPPLAVKAKALRAESLDRVVAHAPARTTPSLPGL